MNIIWGTLLIVIYGSFFISLLICSLSSKGRNWFDRRIQYKEKDLTEKLTTIEHRLGNIESRLDKVEKDVRKIKHQVK